MTAASAHIAKARECLEFARYALAGHYTEEAGRSAYMAGFHAALALIVARTGKAPKTHSGVRSEFARLARAEPGIARDQISFLGWSYELKNVADYQHEGTVSDDEAERAIVVAERLVGMVTSLLGLPAATPDN